jgi:hypothetical protein
MAIILDRVQTYWIPFRMGTTQGPFLPSLVHTAPVVSEEKDENVKS